eukprot:TRINITY_DN3035_c0_g1::TRINITY_DN3035_c0_g1_i1::g.22349::m.22349 TRINITY_DN3035_c0_g1::TRINITY_DN3035_c0_g1_i1::g.22349  ORF type:complete len:253 (-),score=45.61,sp/Q290X1/SWET1_DROPS/30.77/3e-22,MtN3_slv/PF03083.11/5e-14,MtN3_slv/PF03083.11/2.2e-21,EspB/PF05802.6/0.089,DUF1212/PF06738.7/0.059,DUF1212/PF06738.7/1.3e+02,DUF3040/PF11239.3/2.6e+02,DUF3040/PF11239.3/3.3,DUF4131/PF13567.1/1.8,DUF4131/PF13567.1/2.3e+02 TRINITY_DN3035_c0_g1_i1:724-1482(-)
MTFFTLIVQTFAILSTIGFQLSGWKVIEKIKQSANVHDNTPVPFLALFVCCFVWILYGIETKDVAIVFANITGVALGGYYIVTFWQNDHKNVIQTPALASAAILVAGIISAVVSIGILGGLCTIMSIASLSSPLAAIPTVIRTKSIASMPLPIIIGSFCCAMSWTIYGVIRHDTVILLPNALALVLSCVQIVLYTIFSQHDGSHKREGEMESNRTRSRTNSPSVIASLLPGALTSSSSSDAAKDAQSSLESI